jgi:hypothetical protein
MHAPRLSPLVTIITSLLLASAAWAQCSVADIKGDYATQPKGILTGGPYTGPFAGTGIINFDGAGSFFGTATSSFNGNIVFPFYAYGYYNVSADCTVTILDQKLQLGFEGYLSSTKRQVVLVEPDNGTITTNTLDLIRMPAPCTVASLTGSWAFNMAGTDVARIAKFSQLGRLKFDDQGAFSGLLSTSIDGVISRNTVTGKVQVYNDCTFFWKHTDDTGASKLMYGAFSGTGDEIILIYAEDGIVVTGSGRKAAN